MVGFAVNGANALDKIVELQPDLVTLDIQMPELDGLAALRQIMTFHPVPVIMLSSCTEECSNVALQALELGAMDFFQKETLFQRTQNDLMEEEFLLRCKTAMSKKMFLRNETSMLGKEQSIKIHLEMLTFLLKMEEDMLHFHDELQDQIKQQNGLLVKFHQENHKFIYTTWQGSLFNRLGIKEKNAVGKDLFTIFPKDKADFMAPYYQAAWDNEEVIDFETEWHGYYYLTVLRPQTRWCNDGSHFVNCRYYGVAKHGGTYPLFNPS